MRIEVTFNNGKFVAFPDVDEKTIKVDVNGDWLFKFGPSKNTAIFIKNNVNFIEIMENDD